MEIKTIINLEKKEEGRKGWNVKNEGMEMERLKGIGWRVILKRDLDDSVRILIL